MNNNSIGSNIRKYRIEKKLKQENLAEKAGLSTNYIGMVERGEKIPSLETFIRIINALDVSADMVLCDELNYVYQIRNSQLEAKLEALDEASRKRIYAVIDTMIRFS